MTSQSFDQFVGTKPVEERHRFDTTRLEAFMRAQVEGYSGALEVAQFKGGQSNPTIAFRRAASTMSCARSRPANSCPRRMRWIGSTG